MRLLAAGTNRSDPERALTATLVFAEEWFERRLAGWQQRSDDHLAAFVGTFEGTCEVVGGGPVERRDVDRAVDGRVLGVTGGFITGALECLAALWGRSRICGPEGSATRSREQRRIRARTRRA